MSIGRQVERWLTGEPPGAGQATTHERLVAFEADVGSGRAAARRIGIAESTWRGWKKGASPRGANREKYQRAERDARAAATLDLQKIRVDFVQKERKRPDRARSLDARQLRIADPAAGQRIRDAYVAGGAAAAGKALIAEIKDPWYAEQLDLADQDQGDYGFVIG